MAITGQLWFGTDGFGTDERIERVNSDGTSQTVIVQSSSGTSLPGGVNVEDIGLDTAAGFYFAITSNGSGTGAHLVRGSIAGGAPTIIVDYSNGTTAPGDDYLAHALYVDTVAHRIYVGLQDINFSTNTAAKDGIKQYSYDPTTGAVTDLGYLTSVTSSGKPLQGGFPTFEAYDLDFDQTTGNLFFTEDELQGPPTTNLFRLNVSTPNTVVSMLNKTQFPDDHSNGRIVDVEVDPLRHQVYFDTHSDSYSSGSGADNSKFIPAQNAIYTLPDTANGTATATKVVISGLPAGAVHFHPGDMVYDQATNQLYVEDTEDLQTSNDDVIYVLQLSGTGASTTATYLRTISISPAFSSTANIDTLAFNQLVQLGTLSATASVTEQTATAALSTAPTIGDGDGGYLKGATVQIASGAFTGDTLAASTAGTSITASFSGTTLTLTGYDTIAHYRSVIAGVTFNPNNDNPTNYGANTTRTLTYTLDDGSQGVGTGQQNSGSATIGITAVNDAPTVAGAGGSAAYTERAAAVLIATGLTVADPDNTALAGAGVTISAGFQTGDVLGFTAQNGISGSYNTSTGVLMLTGSATLANYQAALRSITFANPTSNDPTAGGSATTRTVSFVTSDGSLTSTAATQTITVSAINDAPVNTVPAAQATAEDTARVFNTANANVISVADPDAGAAGVLETISVSHGTLTLSGTTGISIVSGGNGTASMSFTGTAANVNAALNGLVYAPSANYFGADTLTVLTSDLGHTGSGGTLTDSDTVAITVTAVADTPSVTGATTNEDTQSTTGLVITRNAADGAEVTYVKITGITNGTLYLNDGTTAVANNTFLTYAQANAGLKFTPAANFNGTGSFQAQASTSAANAGLGGGVVTANVTVTAVDDLPVAVADTSTVAENATVTIAVLTNDTDIDGGPKTVATVNGATLSAGQSTTLASGAIVTLNMDGTLGYDPNGKFSYLPSQSVATSTGASNSANDTFSYTLNGGSAANVTVTVTGVASSGSTDHLPGSPGNDTITGPDTATYFDLSQGGNDAATGGAANDLFFVGAALTAADTINGGAGRDQVGLQGDYTGANALVLGATTITNIETIALLGNFSYNITTNEATVANGQTMMIYASELVGGSTFTFNGAAETDGKFVVYAGAGVDNITTGAMNDAIYFGRGRFGASDHVDGGAGTDQVALAGSYSGAITGTQLVSIETLVLLDDAQTPALYNVTLAANWASAGNAKTVYLAELHTNAVVDGSAAVSNLTVYGGFGNDTLTGGAGDDIIYGGPGADRLVGGAGADTFAYLSAAHSSGSSYDTIVGFTPGTDRIDLPGLTPVSAVDADTSGAMGGGSLDDALSAALANLQAGHAVQFTVTDGALAGQVFEVVNTHGTTGYQAGQDFVIHLETPAVHITDPGTFI